MEDWQQLYQKIDWIKFSKTENRTFLYEINFSDTGGVGEYEYENLDRAVLTSCDSFVTEVINKYNNTGFISRYEIIDRILDKNNNLIVLVKRVGNLDL